MRPKRGDMRAVVRLIFVVVTACAALAITLPDIASPWHPFGTLGFEANIDGTVTHIYAGLPAQRAGIRVGDRILGAVGLGATRGAKSSYSMDAPGRTATLTVASPHAPPRSVTLTAVMFPRTLADNITDVAFMCSFTAFIIIAAILLMLRPAIATWAFFLYAIGQISLSAAVVEYLPYVLYVAVTIFTAIAAPVGSFALFVFALAFPQNAFRKWRRTALIFFGFVAAGIVLINVAEAILVETSGIPVPHVAVLGAFLQIVSAYSALMIVAAAIAFGASYVTVDAMARARLRWVILGAIAGTIGTFIIVTMQTLPEIAISPPIWTFNALATLNVLFPIAFSYALLKQRVIEVRFFLSRALVYSLVVTCAVGALALIEFLVGRSLEATGIGLALQVAGAVVVGLGMSRIHGWVDRLVDRYVFRSVYDAERHLEQIGHALMFAQSLHAIDEMIAVESRRALGLESVTVIREFDPDEPLALRLLAGRESIDHEQLLAIPLLLRHHLMGYVLYGHHANGAAIDPNERKILERLTARAATAYDHVASEERAAENERLRIEVNLLRDIVQLKHVGAPTSPR